MAAPGGQKDAFAVLMSAGRSKQQTTTPRKRSNSAPSPDPKRQQTPLLAQSQQASASQPAVNSQRHSQGTERQGPRQGQLQQSPADAQLLPYHPLDQTVLQDSNSTEVTAGPVTAAAQAGSEPAEAQEWLTTATAATAAAAAAAAGGGAVCDSKQAVVAAFKRAFSSGATKQPPAQKFDYLLVYDLEATTNKARTLHPVEIIELSCVIVQAATATITASYQSFVRPTEHPQLDPFAIELCGIQQHQVEAAPLLSDVLQQHHTWLQQQGVLAEGVTCVPVTWTEWDLKVALCTECNWRRIQRPDYLCRWVDLKRHFRTKYKKAGNLKTCVSTAGLTWVGREHSGLDDATNTAKLAIHLMRQGVKFEVTQWSENPLVQQQQQQQPQALQGGSEDVGHSSAAAAAAAGGASIGSQASMPAEAGSKGTPSKGRMSMAQKAAQRGAGTVFDASGKWLGRCFCGAKAKSRVTKRPGPNHMRQFWSCGNWTITAQQSSACDFFMWADDVPQGGQKK